MRSLRLPLSSGFGSRGSNTLKNDFAPYANWVGDMLLTQPALDVPCVNFASGPKSPPRRTMATAASDVPLQETDDDVARVREWLEFKHAGHKLRAFQSSGQYRCEWVIAPGVFCARLGAAHSRQHTFVHVKLNRARQTCDACYYCPDEDCKAAPRTPLSEDMGELVFGKRQKLV